MQAARIRKRRLTPKDARCRASAFEYKKTEAGTGSPPGSPYTVSVELRITTIFSAWSTSLQGWLTRAARLCRFNDNPVQLVVQTTSGPNAVGVRHRHTLPGHGLF